MSSLYLYGYFDGITATLRWCVFYYLSYLYFLTMLAEVRSHNNLSLGTRSWLAMFHAGCFSPDFLPSSWPSINSTVADSRWLSQWRYLNHPNYRSLAFFSVCAPFVGFSLPLRNSLLVPSIVTLLNRVEAVSSGFIEPFPNSEWLCSVISLVFDLVFRTSVLESSEYGNFRDTILLSLSLIGRSKVLNKKLMRLIVFFLLSGREWEARTPRLTPHRLRNTWTDFVSKP